MHNVWTFNQGNTCLSSKGTITSILGAFGKILAAAFRYFFFFLTTSQSRFHVTTKPRPAVLGGALCCETHLAFRRGLRYRCNSNNLQDHISPTVSAFGVSDRHSGLVHSLSAVGPNDGRTECHCMSSPSLTCLLTSWWTLGLCLHLALVILLHGFVWTFLFHRGC